MKDALKLYVKNGNYGWFTVADNGKQDNERVSYFMEVAFKQGAEPSVSPCRIDVGHCFLSCYNTKNGIKPKIVITEYEVEKTFENGGTPPASTAKPAPSAPSAPNVYHAPATPDPAMPYDPYASGSPYAPVDVPTDEDIPF